MLTDVTSRKANRARFLESERIRALDLPQDGCLLAIAHRIDDEGWDNRRSAPRLRRVSECRIGVLQSPCLCYPCLRQGRSESAKVGAPSFSETTIPRPWVIRVWMRTAVRKEITSFGTFPSTLCHEFCHHLDFQHFGFPDSWHTRGFYERAATLYRGTPQKRLFWVPMSGGRWRIDWPKTNRTT